jgi:hypothetical protein
VSNYDDLIVRLRAGATVPLAYKIEHQPPSRKPPSRKELEAADALEALQRERDELSNALAAAKADAATAWERHAMANRLGNAARQELADAKQGTEDIRAVLKAVSPRAFAQMEKIRSEA